MLHGDHVEPVIGDASVGDPQPEEATEHGRVDDGQMQQRHLFGHAVEAELTGERLVLAKSGCARDCVRQSPEALAHRRLGRQLRKADVEPGRCGVHEMTGHLARYDQASRVDRGDLAGGEKPRRLRRVGWNSDRARKVVGRTKRQDRQHRVGIGDIVGNGTDRPVAAGGNHDRRCRARQRNPLRQSLDVVDRDLLHDLDVDLGHRPQCAL